MEGLGSSKWYESNEGNAAQGPFGNSTVFGGLVGSDLWYTAEVTALAATCALRVTLLLLPLSGVFITFCQHLNYTATPNSRPISSLPDGHDKP